jgi:hypothetical protein
MESPPEYLPVILANSRGETAFAGWEMLKVEPADTAGLGWPMNTTAPQWYRLRRGT